MIKFKPDLRLLCRLTLFLNLGTQNRCAQNRYTDVKSGLKRLVPEHLQSSLVIEDFKKATK